jgi:mRNA interferase HicA
VKRRQLTRWLVEHSAQLGQHGREHDWWVGPAGRQAPVPRHREIATHLGREICKQLGIPQPPFK